MSSNYGSISAGDHANQHIGSIYNSITYHNPAKPPVDGSYERGLLDVASKGELSRVRHHVASGTNVNTVDSEGRTALYFATASGHETIARVHLDARCIRDPASQKHGTPLCEAANAGSASMVHLLVNAGADINAPCGGHGSALHATRKSGSLAVLKFLLDAKADINSCCTTKHVASVAVCTPTSIFSTKTVQRRPLRSSLAFSASAELFALRARHRETCIALQRLSCKQWFSLFTTTFVPATT